MTEVISEPTKQSTDTYSAFLQDLRKQDLTILDDNQIRERIKITRDPNSTENAKSKAKNDIIESSLRLIPYLIKELPSNGVPPEELIGQGFEILNTSIDNWNSEQISRKTEDPVKFSSYLIACLKTGLRSQRTITKVDDFMPTPEHVEGIANLMRKARELFLQEEHREPSQDEWYKRSVRLAGEDYSISMLKKVTLETFKATERAKLSGRARFGRGVTSGKVDTDSLSPAVGNVEETLIDKTENTELTAIDNVTREIMEELIRANLQTLTSRERTVLELRFGIGLNEDGEPKEPLILEDVARMFGFTRERIRQIEAKAIRKLRHPSRSKDLKKFFLHEPDEADNTVVERKKQEADYKKFLRRFSNVFLRNHNLPMLVDVLARIQNGDKNTGQIDLEFLRQPPFSRPEEQLELLGKHEKDFGTSPRIFVKDILEFINNNIVSLRNGNVYRDNPDATSYWSNQSPIDIEEVVEKSKELRKIT